MCQSDMTVATRPPFRADHVGSLLRPIELHEARLKAQKGEITPLELRDVEDAAICAAVVLQERAGLHAVTAKAKIRRA